MLRTAERHQKHRVKNHQKISKKQSKNHNPSNSSSTSLGIPPIPLSLKRFATWSTDLQDPQQKVVWRVGGQAKLHTALPGGWTNRGDWQIRRDGKTAKKTPGIIFEYFWHFLTLLRNVPLKWQKCVVQIFTYLSNSWSKSIHPIASNSISVHQSGHMASTDSAAFWARDLAAGPDQLSGTRWWLPGGGLQRLCVLKVNCLLSDARLPSSVGFEFGLSSSHFPTGNINRPTFSPGGWDIHTIIDLSVEMVDLAVSFQVALMNKSWTKTPTQKKNPLAQKKWNKQEWH